MYQTVVFTAGAEFIYTIGIETHNPRNTQEDSVAEDSKVVASESMFACTHAQILSYTFAFHTL